MLTSAPNLEVRAKELLNAADKYQLPRLIVANVQVEEEHWFR